MVLGTYRICDRSLHDINANVMVAIVDAGASDHEVCAKAVIAGQSRRKDPGYLIHLSGTGVIADIIGNKWEGKFNPKIWSDINNIDEIYNLPDEAFHRPIDRDFQNASNDVLKTAIVCPPDIYGKNTGIGSHPSFLVPRFVEELLKCKESFYLGEGENMRAVAHISDVVDVFVLLLGEALKGGGTAQWGREVSQPQTT
jgi:NAD dependent epimerase/dehydratase family